MGFFYFDLGVALNITIRLIKTKEELKQKGHILADYNEFLNHDGVNFKKSPFYDDLMLGKAELLISENNIHEAILIIERIKEFYPNEWTAGKASSLLKNLKEMSHANDD